MRQVKITTGLAGKGYTYQAGQVVDLPDEIAARYVGRKIAIYQDESPDENEGVEINVEIASAPAKRTRKARSKKAKTAEKR